MVSPEFSYTTNSTRFRRRYKMKKKRDRFGRRFPMKRVTSLLCAAIGFFLAGLVVAHAGEYQTAPYTGSPAFERMKQLVGTWEGTSDMGKEGEKVRVEYRLTAGGSALVETLFPGSGEEMVSVYHDS